MLLLVENGLLVEVLLVTPFRVFVNSIGDVVCLFVPFLLKTEFIWLPIPGLLKKLCVEALIMGSWGLNGTVEVFGMLAGKRPGFVCEFM